MHLENQDLTSNNYFFWRIESRSEKGDRGTARITYIVINIKCDNPMNTSNKKSRKELTLEAIVEGKKMEAYVEHRTKDMHVCWICGTIGYKKKPMKNIGNRWICIDCLKHLKEILDSLDQWEAEIQLEKEMSKKIDESLGV